MQLHQHTWDDAAFKQLGADARLLFLWAWSHPGAGPSGLRWPVDAWDMARSFMPAETGKEHHDSWFHRLVDAREQLALKPLVLYDPQGGVLWVVNRARYACRTPGAQKAVQAAYHRLPTTTPIRRMFAAHYPHITTKGEA